MSFAGHVFDMINRSKQNEDLKKSRKERKQKVLYTYNQSGHHIEFVDKNKLPQIELNKLKIKIRKKIIKDNKTTLIISIIVFIIFLLVMYYFYSSY